MTATQAPKLPRRADLQAIRALAIGLVVAAHAHVPYLQGGYVGVDVFFVLSGYLISGLILTEIETRRRFDAWAFYSRRLKRLLPALLTMLFVIAGIAWMLASPQRQGADAEAGQAATLWLSNFYFAAQVVNYFSVGDAGNLFLHTWSLAVEEQFYLAWPWLMLFLLGVWRWQGGLFSRKRLTSGLLTVAALSLLWSTYFAQVNTEVDFYLMPSRVWEFALGALTMLLRQRLDNDADALCWLQAWRGRSVLNGIGLVLILLAAVVYTDNLRYPGLWALLPAVGTALILLDAPEKNRNSLFSKFLLAQPVVQFIGDISYSLYLWHWPMLILAIDVFGSSAWTRLAAVVIGVILAIVSYYAIERPIHLAKLRYSWHVIVPSVLAMAVGFGVMGVWQNNVKQLLVSPGQLRIEMAAMDLPRLYRVPGCDTWYHSAKVEACVFGSRNAAHTVVMFGDSVLAQWFPAIAEIYLRQPGWRLVVLTKSACSASKVSYFYPRIKSMYTVCDIWRQRAVEVMQRLRPDVIFMGSTHYDFTAKQWISGTRSVLDRLSPAAHSVVILSATPELGFDGLRCLSMRAHWPKWLPIEKHCSRTIKPVTKHSVLTLLRTAAKPYANVHVIDMRSHICPDDRCHAELHGHIVYRDGQHLTATFIKTLAQPLRQSLQLDKVPD